MPNYVEPLPGLNSLFPRVNMNEKIISQELNDELMLYKTDSEEIHILNHTARKIYDLFHQKKTVDEMIEILQKDFQITDTQSLRDDIENCMSQLKSKQIV